MPQTKGLCVMRGLFRKENLRRISYSIPIYIVGIIGVAGSIFFWLQTRASENSALVQEFEYRANNQPITLQNGIEDYWDKLYAVRAFFESSNRAITREEFETFSNSLLVDRVAILNISWVPRIKREGRAAHEAEAARDGLIDYHIRSIAQDGRLAVAPERDEYFPKFYSTAVRTAPVYGIDNNDEGAQTINHIRDANVLSISVPLLLRIGNGDRRGFWAGIPVYARGLPHETVEERRSNLLGIVQGVFQIGVMFDTILADVKIPVRLYLFPPNAALNDPSIYSRSRFSTGSIDAQSQADLAAGLHRSYPLKFGDIEWILVVTPESVDSMSTGHQRSLMILAFGLLMSGSVTSFLCVTRRNARKLAKTNDKLRVVNDRFKEQNLQFDAALNNMAQGLLMYDRSGKLVITNRRFAEIFGVPWEEWVIRSLGMTVPQTMQLCDELNKNVTEKNRPEILAAVKDILDHRKPSKVVAERTDGHAICASVTPMIGAGLVVTFEDITERKTAENVISGSNVRHAVVASVTALIDTPSLEEGAPKALCMVGEALKVDRCVVVENVDHPGAPPNMIPTYQWNKSGLEPIMPPFIAKLIKHPDVLSWLAPLNEGKPVITKIANANATIKSILNALKSTSILLIPILVAGKNWGHIGLNDSTPDREWTSIEIETLLALATLFGVTIERGRQIQKISYTARHDILTGLPNRGVFVETLEQAIATAHRVSKTFAVLYLDLDHFKDVNDTLGHPIGDLLLQAVAQRLQASIRETDTVARFGGDEFAILLTDLLEPADTAVLSDKVLKTLSEPFLIQGHDIRTGASIGIEVHGSGAPDAETLLSHADVALYRAKSEERGTYRFFTDAMDAEVRARVTLSANLRDAIASNQLFLVYQPQVDVDTHRIIGLEALVRWRHPKRGLILPAEFIPVAERSGLIATIGHWALHEACRQMKEWLETGIALPLVGVNVSALQFKSPLELENDIAATLADTGLSAKHLELELTETVFMEASREHSDVLLRLRKAGVRIAIDDFGTGYSSLQYLSRFPVDRIKIAQNFTFDITSNSVNATIVKAAIGLAHDLGLDVIVEGVETAEQMHLIRTFSAHKVQGFYFSKPLLVSEVTPLLRVGKAPLKRPAKIEVAA